LISGVYYPVTVLPVWIQPLSWLSPPTPGSGGTQPGDVQRDPSRSSAPGIAGTDLGSRRSVDLWQSRALGQTQCQTEANGV